MRRASDILLGFVFCTVLSIWTIITWPIPMMRGTSYLREELWDIWFGP